MKALKHRKGDLGASNGVEDVGEGEIGTHHCTGNFIDYRRRSDYASEG
jgi:hypothetical protein